MRVDLIIPCYNEEEALPFLYDALQELAQNEPAHSMRFLFVDDGSSDRTLFLLRELAEKDERVRYLSFSRNFGKEAAMLAGLRAADADATGILDADMQHPPALVSTMLRALEQGADIAAARRTLRKSQLSLYRLGAELFYKLSNRFSDVHMPEGAQDFRLMRKKVVDAILAMPEYHRFSKGIFSWVGFDTVWIEHTDTERVAGKTKWNFFSSFQYAIDGMLSFSTKPLSMMVLVGLIISLIGFLYALYVVITTLSGVESAPGFPTLVSLILFFSGITILSIGLMGLYVARIYLEVKARPHYLIAETNLQETHHG